MTRIEELMKQKAELEAQIQSEKATVIESIRAQMKRYGITVTDLGAASAKRTNRAPLPARYKGPNGETWSGRGARPRWLTALLAEGRSIEEFAVRT